MKTALLPASHSKAPRRLPSYTRPLFDICLTSVGLLCAGVTLMATIAHAPYLSWIPDQRITSGTFVTQYFRIINFDGGTPNFMRMVKAIPPTSSTWYDKSNITVALCSNEQGCASDGTGWKITFANTPATSGTATVTITATGTTGAVGRVSFTLQVDKTVGAVNPPSLATLPSYALQQQDSPSMQATYTAQFAIGDLGSSGDYINKEDIDEIFSTDFTFVSNNTPLIDNSTISVAAAPVSSDPDIAAEEGPHSYILTAVTKPNIAGAATITVTLKDPDLNTTSTSFVLQVVPAVGVLVDKPPSIGPDSDYNGTFLVYPTPPTPNPPQYHYIVTSNDSTKPEEHRVTATSSNTNLVPNDSAYLSCSDPDSDGKGTVTITPILPLPAPSPGVPQAATITLSVEDGQYVRQNTFLYIVSPDGGSPVTAYSRPTGVYPTAAPDNDLGNESFLNGTMLNLQWGNSDALNEDHMTHTYDFSDIDAAIATINEQNPFLDLSLDLEGDACYIMDPDNPNHATQTWCDPVPQDQRSCDNLSYCDPPGTSQFERAVPWDSYLRNSRDAYLDQIPQDLDNGEMDYIGVVNTNLPGIETGIRSAGMPFNSTDFPGYTREVLLGAIQDELRTAQKDFRGKLIQIGFFKATDNLGPSSQCTGNPPSCYTDELWQWLYKDASAIDANGVPLYKDENGTPLIALADEFNGVMRPRVSFFQEDLAAARTPNPPSDVQPSSNAPNYSTPYSANTPPVSTTAYTFTPLSSFIPSFAFYGDTVTNDAYNNGIVFQANTVWSDPFMNDQGDKSTNTVNGSPNDAMEAAFNNFHSEYLEIFPQDIDQAIPPSGSPQSLNAVVWADQLQSWHDYAASLRLQAPLEGPAGLNVTYVNSTKLNVTCYPVYGAISYSIDYKSLNGTPST